MKTKIYFLRGENCFVVYVGKTCNSLRTRLADHLRGAQKGHHCKKCCGIRKMLREGKVPTITLQTEVDGDGANAERAYIKWLRSYGINLWNLTDGGEGTAGLVRSRINKERISKSLMGHETSLERRIKIGLGNKNKIRTPEMRERSRVTHKGVPWSKIRRDAQAGVVWSKARRDKHNRKYNKNIG